MFRSFQKALAALLVHAPLVALAVALLLVAVDVRAAAATAWDDRLTRATETKQDYLVTHAVAAGGDVLFLSQAWSDTTLSLLRIDAASGATEWSVDFASGEPASAGVMPTADDGAIVTAPRLGLNMGELAVAKIGADGRTRWISRPALTSPFQKGPFAELANGDVAVSTRSRLTLLDGDTGRELWRVGDFPASVFGAAGILTLHESAPNIVFTVRDLADVLRLHAVSGATGAASWSRSAPGIVAAVQGTAIYVTASNTVTRIDGTNGATVWSHTIEDASSLQLVLDGSGNPVVVFNGATSITFVRLSAATGDELGRTPTGLTNLREASASGNRVVIKTVAADSVVAAFDVATGAEAWRRATPQFLLGQSSGGRFVLFGGDRFPGPSTTPQQARVAALDAAGNTAWDVRPVADQATPGRVGVDTAGGRTYGATVLRNGFVDELVVRAYSSASGLLLWERVEPGNDMTRIEVVDVVAADGRVLVAANLTRPPGEGLGGGTVEARLYSFDATDGQRLWQRVRSGTQTQLVVDGAGDAYVAFGASGFFKTVERVTSSGASAWTHVVTASNILVTLQPIDAGVVIFGDDVHAGGLGVARLATSDGTPAWTAPFTFGALMARVGADDVVVAGASGSLVTAARFALDDGTERWRRDHAPGTPFQFGGGLVAANEGIYLVGRRKESAQERGRFLKLDPMDGDLVWESETPSIPTYFGTTFGGLLDGSELWALRIAETFTWREHRLVRVDRVSGNVLGEHVLASSVDNDPVDGTRDLSIAGRTADGALITRSKQHRLDDPVALRVARVDVPAFDSADLSVTATYGVLDGSSGHALPFELDVGYAGSVAAEGAIVRAVLPAGLRFADLTCTVPGGTCAIESVDGMRATLTLPAGGQGTVAGSIVGAVARGEFDTFVIGQLPFRLADTDRSNDTLTARFSDVMFGDSFE